MKRFGLIVGVMFLLAAGEVLAAQPGSKGAQFLKLGHGARADGMGGAFVAVADDVNALYWNPAGISQAKNKQFTFMHSNWLEKTGYNCLAYLHDEKILGGVMGVSVMMLDSGDIPKYDIDANNSPINLNTTYKSNDLSLSVSYAKEVMRFRSLGLTLKYISRDMDNNKSTGVAMDLGCLHRVNNLSLGVMLQNLGPKMKAYINESYDLPLTLKLGIAAKLVDNSLILSGDVNFPSDNDANLNAGMEYWWVKDRLAIRTGYKTLTMNEFGSSDITFGIGYRLPERGIQLDYASCNYNELGKTYRVSFSVSK